MSGIVRDEAYWCSKLALLQGVIDCLETDRARLRGTLVEIAKMPDENDEWDSVDSFHNARSKAAGAVEYRP